MGEIIFICNANMCRSPMAEGILQWKLDSTGTTGITVSSMGIHAREGSGATENAIAVCAENSIAIEHHRSRPLLPGELKKSEFIFVMEPVQIDFIDIFFPQVSDRIYMLGAWPQRKIKKASIADPVGKSIRAYRKTFNRLQECIDLVFTQIVHYNR